MRVKNRAKVRRKMRVTVGAAWDIGGITRPFRGGVYEVTRTEIQESGDIQALQSKIRVDLVSLRCDFGGMYSCALHWQGGNSAGVTQSPASTPLPSSAALCPRSGRCFPDNVPEAVVAVSWLRSLQIIGGLFRLGKVPKGDR